MIPPNRPEASPDTPSATSDPAAAARRAAAREERLARALRENLKRRKAQARGRRQSGAGEPGNMTSDDGA